MSNHRADEAWRLAYWRRTMDRAFEFMMTMNKYPVEECGEPLVSMPAALEAAAVDVEFSTTPIVQGHPRIFDLRAGLIEDLITIAHQMNDHGWVLKIEDGFRTAEMQTLLARKPEVFDSILRKVIWEQDGEPPDPELMFRRVSVMVATRPKVGTHMSGTAIDISVLDRDTRAPLNRGGPYLEMSELTPMFSPFVAAEAVHNRAQITALMEQHGFVAYPYEFWHYSKGDAYGEYLGHTRQPARYGAVHRDPETGGVERVADPSAPLHTDEEIRREIEQAIASL